MIDEILPIPKIPAALKLAALQRKLVPFVGAGVSQLGGCPGWNAFADDALKFFIEKGKLSHAQLDQMSALSSRVKLSVALELEKTHKIEIDFKALLQPSKNKKDIGDKIYRDLSNLSTTFITTNYDDWLIQGSPATLHIKSGSSPSAANPPDILRTAIYKLTDISAVNLDIHNAVFQIHGSFHDRESMVLTTVQYLDRYASHRIDGKTNHENQFLTFLQTLFSLKNVLFVGYSLNELEILEYVVQKGIEKQKINREEPTHYVLQGFFSHELELARSLESYFLQFGIGLLPFSRDKNDWLQLVAVIERYAQEIPLGPELSVPKRLEMEALLPS
ncbi:MAG: SIR2 family protein [Desulforhabdus sp.]|jgi:hypothetical protein|nr:SIR2 family protein [Desulforhabdus sp.]